MKHLINVGGVDLVVESSSPLSSVDHGVIIPAGDVTVTHGWNSVEFYRHGWNSWSPTGWRRPDEEPLRVSGNPRRLLTADDIVNDRPDRHAGSMMGAVTVGDGHSLLLGALGMGAPQVLAGEGTLEAASDLAECEWFLAYGPDAEVFEQYAELVAARMGHRSGRAGAVWSSWYTCFEDVSMEQLESLVPPLLGLPYDVIQLDDGWQRAIGDWTPNDRFPGGMEPFADMVRTAGKRAGLWLAPLIVRPDSQLFHDHADWMLRDRSGDVTVAGFNWGEDYFTLDTTLPAVQDWLAGVFASVTSWGYTYLKLDFMYAGAIDGNRSQDVHRELAYREAVQLIRDVVGDDVYLLGSGVPMLPSVGVFDGARVGPDTAPYWDNTERVGDPTGPGAWNALCASVNRAWMKPLYEVDPDAVFFRSRHNLLDEETMRVAEDLALVMEFKSSSDPLEWLTAEEMNRLDSFLRSWPSVSRTGRYSFVVDGRTVDFEKWVRPTERFSDAILIK